MAQQSIALWPDSHASLMKRKKLKLYRKMINKIISVVVLSRSITYSDQKQ
jgi:hypothetical protein